MSDDKNISELISKSLRLEPTAEESSQIEKHLGKSAEARQFAELSQLIQQSVSVAGDSIDDDPKASAPGLSDEAKSRLKTSVADAAIEKQSLSQAGLIAPTIDEDSKRTRRISDASISSVAEGGMEEGQMRRVVSNFRLIRKLGEGGLGNVWLAHDEKLNRTVAIKELRLDALESPVAWYRFHREAEITGRLEHPNIVPLYQYGDDRKTSEPFYVMRFVGKRTLADAIGEHHDRVEAGQDTDGMGLHRLLTVFLDVCQAIAYAHSRGVVHRDIKPENVALDNFGQVVVLDWGLAKLLEDGELLQKMTSESQPHEPAFHQTLAGDVLGTPLYMAPEQARGELDKVNCQTDVYGLGAMLFAILTGRAPHEETAVVMSGKPVSEILSAIADRATPKVRDFKGDVPSELESVCSKAMAIKRHLRFESVGDLAHDIERWMAGQSEKKSKYENIRMEGRELRADLQSFVNDAERNVRFMSNLPPIQEIIAAESEEDTNTWRERLTTIYRGLLDANPDYNAVIYSRVENNQFTELVRVERHSKERSSIRSVPRSRLRSAETNDYIEKLSVEKPGEVLVSLVGDPTCDRAVGCENVKGIVAGIPIYDDRTEDSFGIVMIGCDIGRFMERQLTTRRLKASEVIVACDDSRVMARSRHGHLEATSNEKISDVAPHFLPAIQTLRTQEDYIDETDSDVYGARIWFVPKQDGVVYLLKRKED